MNITIEDYSDRAIAVFGDIPSSTKLRLLEAGGKENEKLKGPGDSRRRGWIFPKSKRELVKGLIDGSSTSVPSVTTPLAKSKTVAKDDTGLLSSLLSRIEIMEAELATIKKYAFNLSSSKTKEDNPVAKQASSSNWADEEDSDEEDDNKEKEEQKEMPKPRLLSSRLKK